MSRRIFTWSIAVLLTALLVSCAGAYWLIGTTGGASWLLARAAAFVPGEVDIENIDGSLLEGLELMSVSWRDERSQASIERLDLHFDLGPLLQRRVQVTRLAIKGADVELATTPAGEPAEGPLEIDLPVVLDIAGATLEDARIRLDDRDLDVRLLELDGRLEGPELLVRRLVARTSLGDVELAGDARLAGRYPASASLTWSLRLPERPPMAGFLTLSGDSADYAVTHALSAPYALRTSGHLSLSGGKLNFDLDNSWEEIVVDAENGRRIVSRDGTARLHGTPEDFAVEGRASVLLDELPAFAVALRGSRRGDSVTLDAFSVDSEFGRITGRGEALTAPELTWSADVEIADFDPGVVDARLEGRLAAVASGSGSVVDGRPVAEAHVRDLAGTFNGYPVTGTLNVAYADEVLTIGESVLAIGDNRAEFTARGGEELLLDATLELSNLAQLGVDAAGRLNGAVRLASDAAAPLQLTGRLRGSELAWREYSVRELDARFALPGRLKGSAEVRLDELRIGGAAIAGASVSVTGTAERHRLDVEWTWADTRTVLGASGGLRDRTWSGRLDELIASGAALGEWRLREPANAMIGPGSVDLDRSCLASATSAGYLCAALARKVGGELRFDLSLEELPLAAIPLPLPPAAGASGLIAGHARGTFVNGRITAESVAEIRGLKLSAVVDEERIETVFERAVVSASVTDNRLNANLDFRLAGNADYLSGNLQIDDLFEPASPLNGRGRLELNDLSLFAVLLPDLSDPVGRINGNLAVTGSLEAMEFVGELGLVNGSFGVRRAGITLTDVWLRLRQSRAGLLALEGSARSGDGRIDIDSETTMSASGGIRSELSLAGENFTLLRLPDWRLDASPSIEVVFDERAARVSGELGIPSADINLRDVPESAQRPSGDAVVHRPGEAPPPRRRPILVDVRTTLGDSVSFAGFGLTTGLEGSVRINGSSATTYRSSGRVTLRGGKYTAYGQVLDIERGELFFNGPLTNPSLSIRATRTASDNTVAGIRLSGTPSQLRSEVYSEPPMSDAEALSYLLTGRPLGSAGAADGDMLNQAAFALGLTSAGSVASRIRNDLGLDTLGIQGGAEDRQLVAGKRIGDRLLVEYAYGIVDNLGTLLLRYQLSDRLLIESRSGTARAVDLIYRVRKQ